MKNKVIPIQTDAASINPIPAPQLPEIGLLGDNKRQSIIQHPLMNSIPFGGSFGYAESNDDKW